MKYGAFCRLSLFLSYFLVSVQGLSDGWVLSS